MRRCRPLLAAVVLALLSVPALPAGPSVAAPATRLAPSVQAPSVQAPSVQAPPVQAPPGQEADVVLTLADDGATRTVAVGQTVLIALAAPDVTRPWQGPAGQGPLRLDQYQEHADWYGRPETRALLTAVSGGTTVLSAATDPACLHDVDPCTEQPRRWSATVVVTGPSPTPTPSPTEPVPEVGCDRAPAPAEEDLVVEDAGTTVTVVVGEAVAVDLLSCTGDLTWSAPVADAPVVRRTHPVVTTHGTYARFVGGRPGTAVVSSVRGDRRWSATVTVVAGECVQVRPPAPPSGPGFPLAPPVVGDTVQADWSVVGTFRSARAVQVGYRRTSASRTVPLAAAEAGRPVDLARPGDVTPELRLRSASRVWLVVDAVCQDGTTRRVDSRAQAVLHYPSPVVTLMARRLAPRDYAFSGTVTGGVPRTVLVYRQSGEGEPVLLARTTSSASGAWQLRRRFLGTGRFDLYAVTGGDQVLGPARSDSRPTLVH